MNQSEQEIPTTNVFTEVEIVQQEKKSMFTWGTSWTTPAAIAIFITMVLLTGLFWWQNYSLTQEIENTESQKADYDEKIKELQSDPTVQAAEILEKNKATIVKNIETSNAALYVRELERISGAYGIEFTGFSYASGKITTSVTSVKGLENDAINKVIKFIADYRTGGSKGPFLLNPVMAVSGDADRRTISIEFTVK